MALTVLLVDDDPMARNAMKRVILDDARLRAMNPRVILAASGEQGLAMFVNDRPEVVVTDLIMPGMDGFGFCRAIREAPFGQQVGLIVISGIYKDASLAVSLEKDVRAGFLAKPFSSTELVEAILARMSLPTPDGSAVSPPPVVPQASAPTRASTIPPTSVGLPVQTRPPPAGDGARTFRFPTPSYAGRGGPTGSLSDRGVARLLFDLTDGGQTGTLALSRGQVRKEIYIREGRVVAADSNLRHEALGTLLCAKGIIDERQLAYLLAETKARGHKMGAVLVELGWLSPEDVLQCLAAQVRKRIVDCLRWDEGTWTFIPGDTFGERIIEHDLDIERTIFMGLMRGTTPERLVTRFDANGDRPIRLTKRFDKRRTVFEAVFGAKIVEIIATGASVGSLALHDDSHLIISAVDALLETGLAELGEPVNEPASADHSGTWQSSLSLEKLVKEISRRIVITPRSDGDELFSQVSQSPTPSPDAPSDFFSRPMERRDSGEVDMGVHAFSLAPEKHAGAEPPSESTRQDILRTYLSMRGKPLYEALGVNREASTAEILAAVSAMAERFSPARLAGIELSSADQANLESLRAALDHAARHLANPQLRQKYDRSLAQAAAPKIDRLGAELAFGEGMQLFNNDRVAEALPKFQAAVQARPDQALYQAYLGWAQFVAHGAAYADTAREAIRLALSLDPDLAEAHAMLGQLAATENDADTARACLQRSLELQPEQPETIDLLFEAYRRLNDPRGAEAFLRKLVAALGEHARPLQRRLWRELAIIYEQQLGDRLSARIAYDTAARLAPTDLDILRKSAEMNAEDPSRWREMSRAITAEWNLNPQDPSAGERLLDLYTTHGLTEAATIVAAAMVLRGGATMDTLALAKQGGDTKVMRWPGKLPADWTVRLGYPPEFTAVENLLALLAESGVFPPSTIRELGLDEGESQLAPGAQPSHFRSTLVALCELLEVAEPRVFLHPAFASEAHMAHTQPPSLFCGRDLIDQQDPVELAFRLSRALALAPLGRLAGSTRSGGQLRPFFMAALAIARGGLRSENPAFEAAKACLALLPTPVRARIAESSQALVREYGSINLTAWTKSLARTATRLSLLVCGDLLKVGSAIAEEVGPAALEDLLSFALSLDYLDLSGEIHASAT